MEEGCFATFTCLIEKYLRCFSIYTALNRTLRVRLSERDTIEKTPPRGNVLPIVALIELNWYLICNEILRSVEMLKGGQWSLALPA